MITEEQARAQGADDIDIFLGICNEEIIPSSKPSRLEQLHGKIVGTRTEPYHDVTVYEDGYEDWFYIGEEEAKHEILQHYAPGNAGQLPEKGSSTGD